jgi:hypothetical protein
MKNRVLASHRHPNIPKRECIGYFRFESPPIFRDTTSASDQTGIRASAALAQGSLTIAQGHRRVPERLLLGFVHPF